MRLILHKDRAPSSLSRLVWGVAGFAFVSVGSAALGWQNNNAALKPALVVEAAPSTMEEDEPAPQVRSAPIVNHAPPTASPSAAAPGPIASPASPVASPAGEANPSILPWPWSLGAKRESNPNMRRPTPIRSAGSKATGNYGRLRRAEDRPAEPTATPQPALRQAAQPLPTPARREPVLAERPAPAVSKPTPAPKEPTPALTKPAPLAVKPAPILTPEEAQASSRRPTPVDVTQRPAPTRVAEPVVKDVPRAALTTSRKLPSLNVKAITDVRPAGFQDVLPGQSKVSEVAQQLGEPEATLREGDTTVMTYQVGPFPKLEVILAGDVVDSIVIHLAEPVEQAAVLEELGLSEFRPVAIMDEAGRVLGAAIPERGVALSYSEESEAKLVGQVVLATITAEPFVLRATTSSSDYQQMLADADYALTLDPDAADAHAIRARVLTSLGRISEARTAIEAAIKLDDGAPDYRILYAELLSAGGDYDNALTMVKTISETPGVAPAFAAAAELAWGNLLSHGPERDYPAAVTHHTKAIKLATPLAQSASVSERRVALRILIDANLAVARDVALGNYKRQSEVVPKWLEKAQALQQLALQDGDDDLLELQVASKSLSAMVGMSEPLDPSDAVETALSLGQELIAATDDPLHKQQLEWLLGVALLDAVQIEHARGEFDVAMQYANNALTLLGDNVGYRESTLLRDHTMGRMYFSIGALYAVGRNDHTEAVHYYLQAIPLLDQPLPPELAEDRGRHGERMVSMGVSFWQNGNKPQAIELTLKGAKTVQAAVEAKELDDASLAVPYGNLAAMYRQLGKNPEAEKYGELVKRIEPVKTSRR